MRKRLTHARPADPERRPRPRADFLAAQPLLPGILMAWDFCSTYRAVLRLPPFPLARLELAFLDAPPADVAADAAADVGGPASSSAGQPPGQPLGQQRPATPQPAGVNPSPPPSFQMQF